MSIIWAALAALTLGAVAPGCFLYPPNDAPDDALGSLCAAPESGGEFCVRSNQDPADAWKQAAAHVDGVLKQDFGALADEMKDGLNLWEGGPLDLTKTHLYQTISAFSAAMSTIGDGFTAYAEMMQTLVHATTRVAIGFVPYVGPALDLCEVVTGKEWCLPSGRDLSTEERIFSGTGVAVGAVVPFWKGAKNAAISPAAKLVAETIPLFGEELATALRANRKTFYKTLEGAVTSKKMDEFERKAALYLMKNEGRALIGVGDDGVRQVLKIPKVSPFGTDLGKAPDFLSMTKGGKLAVGEAKGGTIGEMKKQLTNGMNKLKERGLAGDVERVETLRAKGASLGDQDLKIVNGYLVKWSTGERVTLEGFKTFIMVIEL